MNKNLQKIRDYDRTKLEEIKNKLSELNVEFFKLFSKNNYFGCYRYKCLEIDNKINASVNSIEEMIFDMSAEEL